MKKVKVYLYISDFNWEQNKREELLKIFEEFNAEHKEKAAIGAGASGPFPELNLLVIVSAALGAVAGQIGGGFLNAVGEDAWKVLKGAIKKALKVKPDKMEPSLPQEMQNSKRSELIWWNYFTDKQFLVHLPTNNTKEWDEALEKLPAAVDKANKTTPSFIRLIWNNGEWQAI